MRASIFTILLIFLNFCVSTAVPANPLAGAASKAVPHRAIYDIDMVASRSGAQVVDVHGKMFYEWGSTCDAWVTNHRFNLVYEYADSPGMRVSSDFSTYEPMDEGSFNFSSRRQRDGQLYQDLRGHADLTQAVYTAPEGLSFDMPQGIMFPTAHTLRMLERFDTAPGFFFATVFDGSDEEGPIEINTFIGGTVNPLKTLKPSDALDMSLLNTPARRVHMAVFPVDSEEAKSDYEMSLVFHDNGIISDMVIDYDHFSVRQTLVALEKMTGQADCSGLPKKEAADKAKP